MFTRKEIIDFSIRIWCKKDLVTKGVVAALSGDVICLATLSGEYPDGEYYRRNQKSPNEVYYCGVYSIRAECRLDPRDSETRKNIAVTKTDGKKNLSIF